MKENKKERWNGKKQKDEKENRTITKYKDKRERWKGKKHKDYLNYKQKKKDKKEILMVINKKDK